MIDVRMPKLGESVTEGTVSRWLKVPGDTVALREPLLEISTDKIDTEIPSPAGGTLLEVLITEGKTVAVGTVLARIGERGAGASVVSTSVGNVSANTDAPTTNAPTTNAPTTNAPTTNAPTTNAPTTNALTTDAPTTDAPTTGAPTTGAPTSDAPTHRRTDVLPSAPGRNYLSPVVQRIAAEHAINLANVTGTGLGGRITKKDLLVLIGSGAQPGNAQPGNAQTINAGRSTPQDQQLTPLSAMRRAISQHVSQSVRIAPHVATIFEVDMSRVVRHREAERGAAMQRGIRLTYSAYFIYAVAQALRRHPQINNRYTDRGIVHNAGIHIGVAVALGKDGADGLLAPVLRYADEMTLYGVARALGERTERVRAGQLLPDDLQGGTFTVTNHGVGGSLIGTPIIVQPQSAILGVGAIVKRAIVKSAETSLLPSADDAIVIRPVCYLTLSFDHRILDGASADAYLRDVQYQLETFEISVPK